MKVPFDVIPMPATREPVSLLSVARAVAEFRGERAVVIRGGGGTAVLALAAEIAGAETLAAMVARCRATPSLAVTARRAAVLGLAHSAGRIVVISSDECLDAETIRALADPLADPVAEGTLGEAERAELAVTAKETPTYDCESAAVILARLARLLPAAVTVPVLDPSADDLAAWAHRQDLLLVDAGDIFQYDATSARRLSRVGEARVPLDGAEETRIVAFRPGDGGQEHLAIIVGNPEAGEPVLTRVHSECFTGDLLGSLRCDCGDQLQGAMAEIKAAGEGILLYLAQEGRGIGLVNKLRAYALQDQGLDTIDANEQLGFDADERIYLPAAKMLRELGFSSIRLMTNNPDKVTALEHTGITVAERVPHRFPSNKHNEAYLRTKAARAGHIY